MYRVWFKNGHHTFCEYWTEERLRSVLTFNPASIEAYIKLKEN